MPLEILLALVVIGIAGIAVLLHLTGRSDQTSLNTATAQAQWLRHFPQDEIVDITLAASGQSALVRTVQGPGLLWVFGADTVARHLNGADLVETDTGLRVLFHDYAVPALSLTLTETERQHWQTLISNT